MGIGDMFKFLNDIDNYDDRKVASTKVNGVTVSTVYTSDEGYETAILDVNGTHPVERYPNKDAAKIGHDKWAEKAKTATTIIKLGWLGVVDDKPITINRGD